MRHLGKFFHFNAALGQKIFALANYLQFRCLCHLYSKIVYARFQDSNKNSSQNYLAGVTQN